MLVSYLIVLSVAVVCFASQVDKNVLGSKLQVCGTDPMTGWTRDGYCRKRKGDSGVHTVCAKVTEEFLDFAKAGHNDLRSIPLKGGDNWCLCETWWKKALNKGVAPPLVLESTHSSAKAILPSDFKKFAIQ